jgi:hypothetical protein
MTVDWTLNRLRELRSEYADGEAQLLQLDRHRAQVQDALLRVAGAIQVLEELVAASGVFTPEADPVTEAAVAPPAG